jgi:alkylation response protein AidB-like acyl-CoA dehydrogenase
VVGLKGTRSEGFSVKDHFIEDALTLDRETPSERRYDGTLFLVPTTNVYAACFSGVALGISRAMLDALLDLARTKTPRGAPSSLKESAVFHTRFAELEAQHRAARAYQQSALAEVWGEVERTRDITLQQRIDIRLATTHAINVATSISEDVWRMAGSTAIHEGGPFERRFRDIHAVSQQVQGRHTNFESVGRHMLGLEIDTMFV